MDRDLFWQHAENSISETTLLGGFRKAGFWDVSDQPAHYFVNSNHSVELFFTKCPCLEDNASPAGCSWPVLGMPLLKEPPSHAHTSLCSRALLPQPLPAQWARSQLEQLPSHSPQINPATSHWLGKAQKTPAVAFTEETSLGGKRYVVWKS